MALHREPRSARPHDAASAFVICILLASFRPAELLGQIRFVRCDACHAAENGQFKLSVHGTAVRCQQCHGGQDDYGLTVEQLAVYTSSTSQNATSQPTSRASGFDHGASFRGKARRAEIPALCGTCHADVQRMNPYGLRTDQLAAYWVSGHGKQLKEKGDERVAVCIDCHGAHDITRHDNPASRTFFKNIPSTCGRCHGDAELMKAYDISSDIVDQYRRSVHGRNLLERGDADSPNCATCHGNHAAAPPGFQEVSHVCGQCHKQVEDYFLTSIHGRIPVMARCIGCHAKGGQRFNHEILEASLPVDRLPEIYSRLAAQSGVSPESLPKRFEEEVAELSGPTQLANVCGYCHGSARRDPHAQFFQASDKLAVEVGGELNTALRDAQWEYARAASRVAQVGRGVLLVQDEAVRVEDAKTEVVALYAFLHTLDRPEISKRKQNVHDICKEVNDSLDAKEQGLTLRRGSLAPVWIFGTVFSVLMYRKYKALRHAYVRPAGAAEALVTLGTAGGGGAPCTAPSLSRRRLLDGILGVMGASAIASLVWPALAYILPVRKRGGGSDRTSAGKETEYAVWEAKKVSVRGKPVVVLRTDKGFQAFSAICTHLGCIVHWDGVNRKFLCPCHAATFDAGGKVVSGPPPKALPEYSVSVAQGEVIVKGLQEG